MSVTNSLLGIKTKAFKQSVNSKTLVQLAEGIFTEDELGDIDYVNRIWTETEEEREQLVQTIREFCVTVLNNESATLDNIPEEYWKNLSIVHQKRIGPGTIVDNEGLDRIVTSLKVHRRKRFRQYLLRFILIPTIAALFLVFSEHTAVLQFAGFLILFVCAATLWLPIKIIRRQYKDKKKRLSLATNVEYYTVVDNPDSISTVELYEILQLMITSELHRHTESFTEKISTQADWVQCHRSSFANTAIHYLVGHERSQKDYERNKGKGWGWTDIYHFTYENDQLLRGELYDSNMGFIDIVESGGNIHDRLQVDFYDTTCPVQAELIESCDANRKEEIYKSVIENQEGTDEIKKDTAEAVIKWIDGMQDILRYSKEEDMNVILYLS